MRCFKTALILGSLVSVSAWSEGRRADRPVGFYAGFGETVGPGASVAYSPLNILRMNVGMGMNGQATAVNAGIKVLPFGSYAVTPILGFSYAHWVSGTKVGSDASEGNLQMAQLGVDYQNASGFSISGGPTLIMFDFEGAFPAAYMNVGWFF